MYLPQDQPWVELSENFATLLLIKEICEARKEADRLPSAKEAVSAVALNTSKVL